MLQTKAYQIALFLLFLFSGVQAQSTQARQVLDMESRRFSAMIQADTNALKLMLSDDLMYIHSNALRESKAAHLKAIGSRKLIYEKLDRKEAQVRFYGKTALVNGVVNAKGVLNGNPFDIMLVYTAVYRRKHGSWQLLNWQSTKMP